MKKLYYRKHKDWSEKDKIIEIKNRQPIFYRALYIAVWSLKLISLIY